MVNERVARSRQKSVAKLFFVVGLLLLFAPVLFQDVAWVHDSIYALLISGAVVFIASTVIIKRGPGR